MKKEMKKELQGVNLPNLHGVGNSVLKIGREENINNIQEQDVVLNFLPKRGREK